MLTEKEKFQVLTGVNNIQKILDSKKLQSTDEDYKGAFIEILISLKDLLIKSDKLLSKRVKFTDDVIIDKDLRINDVTGLISYFRNCVCHPETEDADLDSNTLKYNIFIGIGGISIGDKFIGNKYNDDIGYNMGQHTLLLNRHIIRSFIEVKNNFQQYLQ
ncbi:hypothetical protein NAL32_07590 [Chryseobacterium sp. Ch-15]|uniref:Uncharacterized protein n=1 Tax=Chryseobacterium muglaense TaxID=2893752 RepID=A0A9Q3URG0_9FLAO|nr:hypothetical protein [Chryseobacterium muglaense]MBD3904493.1 hypothetical protein [Chryseobacterium muglaense]MCC9032688.1 hypothetical protein [Chryseobacterium muglaense]MCM2554255.1 hypothetical protein [Chryseobacterium muglaense]